MTDEPGRIEVDADVMNRAEAALEAVFVEDAGEEPSILQPPS